ncbi:PAAR domain-containing protein [Acinetobacter stercoris]|uniref:Chitinase class I n=1 Tax=Acinetobacter stercoris TaxID=2126983 RepID=A0A2U3N492_9GAMM|nr:PAAR domain-containing protein [Acinetobacter stercoris]SPL72379.1 Chitinase class I [Acinetobacter stercoris]
MAIGMGLDGMTTTHGGIVKATTDLSFDMGRPFLRVGDGFFCPKCKVWSTLLDVYPHVVMDGKAVVPLNAKFSCGAELMGVNNHTVMEYGSGSGLASQVSYFKNQDLNNSLVDEKEKEETCFCDKEISLELLKQILPKEALSKGLFYKSVYPKIKGLDINKFLELLNKYMKEYEINTCMRKAHFLAQISCEGDHFRTTEEYKNKDGSFPKGWYRYFGGPAYHGRGLIQLTHDINYDKYGAAIGQKFTMNNLDLVASEPEHIVHSATWYWAKGSIWGNGNIYSDKDDLHYVTILVNGGFNDYCGRKSNLLKLLQLMKIKELCPKVKDREIGKYSFSTSKLNHSKGGKSTWLRYHTRKDLISNVSCEPK